MMTSSNGNILVLLDLCEGNSPVAGEFPSQRPVTRSFDVFFDVRLKNGWAIHQDAGDLRRHRAHYDITVMSTTYYMNFSAQIRKCFGKYTPNVVR